MTRLTVRDVMTTNVAAVRKSTPFKEVARALAERRISALPILDEDDRLAGIVSEADLLPKEEYQDETGTPIFATRRERAARERAAGDTAGQLMTTPVITITPEVRVAEAARIMDRAGVKRLPVIDAENRVIGIITRGDLLRVFLRGDDEIREEVVREVFMRMLWADPTRFDVEVRDGIVVLTGEVQQKSDIAVGVRLTRAVDGVVDVINKLTFRFDDTKKARARHRRH